MWIFRQSFNCLVLSDSLSRYSTLRIKKMLKKSVAERILSNGYSTSKYSTCQKIARYLKKCSFLVTTVLPIKVLFERTKQWKILIAVIFLFLWHIDTTSFKKKLCHFWINRCNNRGRRCRRRRSAKVDRGARTNN